MEFTIHPAQPFSFRATIFSHGWVDLLPFRYDADSDTLMTALKIQDTCRNLVLASRTDADIVVKSENHISDSEVTNIRERVKKMFRLKEDFGEFYNVASRYKKYEWIVQKKVGRMFRSGTVWEDMVKMLCTTNCNWSMTKLMVGNLVNKLGNGCFPAPEVICRLTEDYLREEIKLGYRSAYLLGLSRSIVNGELEPERFENWTEDSESLYSELRRIRGFGHYAASGLLKLLGHYHFMGSDSWSRKKFSEKYGHNRQCSEKDIMRFYQHLGSWRGLFFWLDMTREWHEKNPSGASL